MGFRRRSKKIRAMDSTQRISREMTKGIEMLADRFHQSSTSVTWMTISPWSRLSLLTAKKSFGERPKRTLMTLTTVSVKNSRVRQVKEVK
jgi:hypothetical protein